MVLLGIVLGSLYGVFVRWAFGLARAPKGDLGATPIMTVAFLIFAPVAIGYLTIGPAEKLFPRKVWQWVMVPWIPIVISTVIAGLIDLEGLICIVMALPVTMTFGTLGGVAAGILTKRAKNRAGVITACFAVLPFLLAPIETRIDAPIDHRRVDTQIAISAPAERVWANIERVPLIQSTELPKAWTHSIGFPRPLEASLSYEGVGGVRHATFEGGLLFVETVTEWDRNHVLAFTIKADTKSIPPTTLDEHVTIGGKYFDVLNGRYSIEQVPQGGVILHLSSDERLSTSFNLYAGLWSDAVMRSIQESILKVIKQRCEKALQD